MCNVGDIARMGRREMHTGFWCGDLRARYHLEDPKVEGMIIFKYMFRKWNGVLGLNRLD